MYRAREISSYQWIVVRVDGKRTPLGVIEVEVTVGQIVQRSADLYYVHLRQADQGPNIIIGTKDGQPAGTYSSMVNALASFHTLGRPLVELPSDGEIH